MERSFSSMRWAIFFSFVFFILASAMLFIYFFVPLEKVEFQITNKNYSSSNHNFSLDSNAPKQFYDGMRYPSPEISYRIYNCPLQRKADMEGALGIVQSATILKFHSVDGSEEISITCEDTIKADKNFFIAGEGGPTNITKTSNFNVILHGGILLLRDSNCERPNVAIHELLHSLGFDHSQNPNNVMYNISRCSQTIGYDMTQKIYELYSTPQLSDLSIENASASMSGRYLDVKVSVRNNGLKDSKNAKLIISDNNKILKEVSVNPMKIGYGLEMTFGNIFISDFSVKYLTVEISSNFDELDKNNNKAVLEIKS